MRYLLDTNIFLFMLMDREQIHRDITILLDDYDNLFYFSTISIQEIIHLYQTHKIKNVWKSPHDILPTIEEAGLILLPVKKEHLVTYANLNLIQSHKDPNDRVIISQAITEKLTLVSSDKKFAEYTNQNLHFILNRR